MKNTHVTIIATLLFLVIVTGCAQPTPVIIYVTPTPETVGSEPTALINTVTPTPSVIQPTILPPTTDAPSATVTFIGPVVQPDYQLPVTSTPIPQPTASPQVIPSDQPLDQPTETPISVTPTRPTILGTPIPNLDASDLGIQSVSFLTLDDTGEVMRQIDSDLQLGWVKFQIAWNFYQPNGPGETTEDLRRLEIFIEQIRQQAQVKVLVSIAKAPDWARTDTTEDGPPDDPQQLADFITLLLRETNNSIDAVEIWNEPNLAREWRGQPLSGASYMEYFRVGYETVKAYNPSVVVISAGLAPTGNTPTSRNDREYLREMYDAGLASFDSIGVGVHPYGWGNPPDARCCQLDDTRGWDDAPQFFFLDTLEDYREIMLAYDDQDSQLWLTEFGWATWEGLPGDPPDVWMRYNSKWDQANYALRAVQIGQSLDYVGPMFLWNLNFAQPILIEQGDERVAYSIVLPEGAPRERPLYWMLYDATRGDITLDSYD